MGWPNQPSTRATRAIVHTVQQIQAISPNAPNFIMGDFNNCKPGKSLGTFYQYVTCATRLTKLLDLCHGSLKGAYKSLRRAPLGASDHNVYLVPSYKPVLKRHKPERRLVLVWSEESIQRLQDCCACTDWDLFMRVWMKPETVSDYVRFCEDSIIRKRSISIFPNNKPWVSKSVKYICYNKGDVEKCKKLQKQVRKELKLAKRRYKDKVENMLSTASSRPEWEAVKAMLGMQSQKVWHLSEW